MSNKDNPGRNLFLHRGSALGIYLLQFLNGVACLLEHVLLLLTEALGLLHFGLQLVDLLLKLLHLVLQDGLTLLGCHDVLFFFLDGGVEVLDILLLLLSFFERQLRQPAKLTNHLLDLVVMVLVVVYRCKQRMRIG